MVELAKIGNNINQIARALNIIKNADSQEQRKLDIFSVLLVLKIIQTELQNIFPALPKISRQSPERLQKQLKDLQLEDKKEEEEEKTTTEPKSIDLAEEDESAY